MIPWVEFFASVVVVLVAFALALPWVARGLRAVGGLLDRYEDWVNSR